MHVSSFMLVYRVVKYFEMSLYIIPFTCFYRNLKYAMSTLWCLSYFCVSLGAGSEHLWANLHKSNMAADDVCVPIVCVYACGVVPV